MSAASAELLVKATGCTLNARAFHRLSIQEVAYGRRQSDSADSHRRHRHPLRARHARRSRLFFTGHEASDFERGIAAPVAGKPGLPLDGQARYRREADYVLARLAKLIAAEGGDLRHIVRVDQYYPSALAVNPYQRARKALLKDYVPPSTSVLMEELLVVGANLDLSMLAVLPGEGREPHPARPGGVPVPQHSGFIHLWSAEITCSSPDRCQTTRR